MEENKCPECGVTEFFNDEGELICKQCGFILNPIQGKTEFSKEVREHFDKLDKDIKSKL